jgi:hypothetical protein
MKTRTELVNSSRIANALDKLPAYNENMFDVLGGFKKGTRSFVNLSSPTKP